MSLHSITLDLYKPFENYKSLYKAVAAYKSVVQICESTFLVKSDQSAVDIRNQLMNFVSKNDRVFVATLNGDSAWVNFDSYDSNWIKESSSYGRLCA